MKLNKRGKRNLTIAAVLTYIMLLGNSNVQAFLGNAVNYAVEGSTTYCYQEGVEEAWWMNRI